MMDGQRRYLIFTLHGRYYALDLAQVAEVSEPPVTWPMPAAPPYYPGAMNFHGVIVAVMDLAAFMGRPSCHDSEKVIVLDSAIAALAFLVERVIRIIPADGIELLEAPADSGAVARLVLPDEEALLLDGVAIARKATEDFA